MMAMGLDMMLRWDVMEKSREVGFMRFWRRMGMEPDGRCDIRSWRIDLISKYLISKRVVE